MVSNMKTLENLLERGVITLSGNNDNIFYIDRSKNIGKTTWGEIDSLKFIGYTQGNQIMEKEIAIEWWDNLTEENKSSFPTPNNNQDILNYYLNPAEHIQLEYGML